MVAERDERTDGRTAAELMGLGPIDLAMDRVYGAMLRMRIAFKKLPRAFTKVGDAIHALSLEAERHGIPPTPPTDTG